MSKGSAKRPTSVTKDEWDINYLIAFGKIKCPSCDGKLEIIEEDEPWNTEHIMCCECDSTYNMEDFTND